MAEMKTRRDDNFTIARRLRCVNRRLRGNRDIKEPVDGASVVEAPVAKYGINRPRWKPDARLRREDRHNRCVRFVLLVATVVSFDRVNCTSTKQFHFEGLSFLDTAEILSHEIGDDLSVGRGLAGTADPLPKPSPPAG